MNIEQVTSASTSELVAFYNKNCECFGKKQVKKFADRATAQLRVRHMIEDIEAEQEELNVSSAPSQLAICLGLAPASSATQGMVCAAPQTHVVFDNFDQVTEEEHRFHRGEIETKVSVSTGEEREAMKTSLKLDRTIMAYDENMVQLGVWPNACNMWKLNLDWMTSAQQDGMTGKLYKAAKQGEKIRVVINNRTFELVNV